MKKIKHLLNTRVTLIVAPERNGQLHQLRFNPFLLQCALVSAAVILVGALLYGGVMTQRWASAEHLNSHYRAQIEARDLTIAQLHANSRSEQASIIDLNEQLAQSDDYFQSKVAEIAMLESELNGLIGKFNADNHTTVQMPASRSGELARSSQQLIKPIATAETFGEDVISEEITAQVMRYTNLADDIEAKLDYIDAKPSLMPAVGRLSSPFGNRRDPFSHRVTFHKGIDIANNYGTDIRAAGAGMVTFSGRNQSYGNVIVISHGYQYDSLYAHCTDLLVEVGDRVERGQLIATMGSTGKSTGPHLHFEIHYNDTHVDPLNVLKAGE